MLVFLLSEESRSISMASSFVSLPRPAFPTALTPTSSFNSQRSTKSPLQPYNPHPQFNEIATKVLQNLDNNCNAEVSRQVSKSQDNLSQYGKHRLYTSLNGMWEFLLCVEIWQWNLLRWCRETVGYRYKQQITVTSTCSYWLSLALSNTGWLMASGWLNATCVIPH